jgi:hypothetical protein
MTKDALKRANELIQQSEDATYDLEQFDKLSPDDAASDFRASIRSTGGSPSLQFIPKEVLLKFKADCSAILAERIKKIHAELESL